jgi:peptide/nickel transport system permease protein
MLRAFRRAPSGMLGAAAILLIALVAVLAPIFLGRAAAAFDVLQASQNPSAAHLLGTDQLGRDLFVRILVATRLSIGLALLATAIGAAIGVPLGAITAILPRRPRMVLQRAIDSLLAFPAIIVAIFVGAIIGTGSLGALLGVGISLSFAFARVASTLALSIGGREYVVAARVVGVSPVRRFLRYILPNIAETMIIQTTVAVSNSIVFVSALSFLGLGVQPPQFDWGRMLTEGVQSFYVTPAAALGPAAAIAVSAVAFGFAGEAMARAMNPLLWGSGELTPVEPALATNLGPMPELQVAKPKLLSGNGSSGQAEAPVVRPALEVEDLYVTFPGASGPIEIVAGVTFSIAKGETLGIVGESGSGKTMTAMAIAQLVPYPGTVKGTIRLDGKDLSKLAAGQLNRFLSTDLAVVFQDPMSSLNPALKMGTQLTEAAEVHRGLSHHQATAAAVTRLREVNIPTPEKQMDRHPHEFSGGMRQRAMIAMGLMNDPAVLIADEPTTALDVTIQAQIIDLLAKVNAEHQAAIIFISHNLALVKQTCHRVLVMYAGRIVEEIPSDRLLLDPLHPYTRALIAAVPDMLRARDEPLAYIPGSAPDLADIPSGCPFHPRCPLAVDKCRTKRPPLEERAAARRVACWVANEDVN